MLARCSAEEKQKVINRYFVDKDSVNTIASESGIPCGTIYSWIEQHKQKHFENSTEKHIDLSTLPRRKYGKELHIEWSKSVGHTLPFVYGHITGELEILEHHKGNYVVVRFQNKSKRLRTNALIDMKITDLFSIEDRKRLNPNTKAHETFVSEVKALYQDEYTVLSTYVSNKTPIQIRHNSRICNYGIFSPTPNNFLRGSGCPYCYSSRSFPEICIMMAVSILFPNAKKERIEGRECDIVFSHQGRRIGIQYDGCYYHKNAEMDEAFNDIFLSDPQSYLIRIREKGCPELKTHERAFYLSASTNYSIKKLQELFNSLFAHINSITGCGFHPQMTKQLWQKARQEFHTYHPKLLAEEYIAYSDTHESSQHQQEPPLLRKQVESALQKEHFSGEILEHLYALQQQKKLLVRAERDPQSILCSLKNFLQENGRLPRQQKGDAAEHRLYLEMKSCLTNHRFSEKQLVEFQQLRKQSANTSMTSQELFEEYVQFVRENHRLPNASGSAAEKSLDCKVAHRLFRNTFTREQEEEIRKLRQKFSLKNRKNRIIAEYRQFIQNNHRLPEHSAPGSEGALERSMQYYLRKGVFSAEERNMIAEMRAVYQTLSKQLRDQVQYFKNVPEAFIEEKYVQFVEKKGRLPCVRGDKEERELCRIVLCHLNTENFPITKT